MEMIAQRTPGTKLDTNVDRYVDERLLDELEREGLFKRVMYLRQSRRLDL